MYIVAELQTNGETTAVLNYTYKVHRKPRLMATNLQGSSHRPRAVGFRPRQPKGFYL